ncbi:flagellar hook-associated protein FlgK [Natranaerobius trueperi]|uniref:Flagellar hook-associated protein 1 n=1 Tax=Natranaerobius trueperi TaxID=759412 RepID=A0A226C2K4_9FIRM|nr:flagellar hook-associated protein FlgK [Natranaerobius trueperi]OWZ84854.1 flagellar hook-associated protein FlgK [Natranaerobius trueperi]
MRSSFFGIETARRALFANSKALDTAGHNIANANTEGYTRQKVNMSATSPYSRPGINSPHGAGQIGTGVEAESIDRIRDEFIDTQIRNETNSKGEWNMKYDTLKKIESIYSEPSDSGIRNVFDQFWDSLQELSQNPEDRTARTQVKERGVSLADTVNHMYNQLTDLKKDLDENIKINVDDINSKANQIADLNEQIQNVEVKSNQNANDLRDKRDQLLDELSELTDFNLSEDDMGNARVTIGGTSLVNGTDVNELEYIPEDELEIEEDDDFLETPDSEPKGGKVIWNHTEREVNFGEGEMNGLIESRDEIVDHHIDELRSLTYQLSESFNAIHGADDAFNHYEAQGNGDNRQDDFFEFKNDGSRFIDVNEEIQQDVNLINAGYEKDDEGKYLGNGENARRLADLKSHSIIHENVNEDTFDGIEDLDDIDGTATFNDFIDSTVADLGVETQEAMRMVENQELLVGQLENQREAVSGVSLDEEMTNMIKHQHAYNAASRVITTIDESLDTIINRMGTVGR